MRLPLLQLHKPEHRFDNLSGAGIACLAHQEKDQFFKSGLPAVHNIDPEIDEMNRSLCLPMLEQALWGDSDAQRAYEQQRLGNFESAPEWLKLGLDNFCTERLNQKKWITLIWFRDLRENEKSLEGFPVGDLLQKEIPHSSIAQWLGLGLGRTHFLTKVLIEKEGEIGIAQSTFPQLFTAIRAGYHHYFKGSPPTYGLRSIFIRSPDGDFLRDIALKGENFRFAGQLIEDFCFKANIPLSDEQKLKFTKTCWTNPWAQVSEKLFNRVQRTLAFIDTHREKFKGSKDVSEFFIAAVEASSIRDYLENRLIDLNKRKSSKTGEQLESIGKTVSMKGYFRAALSHRNLSRCDEEILVLAFLHAWRLSPLDASESLLQLIASDEADLSKILEDWKNKNLPGIKNTEERIEVPHSDSPPNPKKPERVEVSMLSITPEGDTTPFDETINRLERGGQVDLVNTIYQRIGRIRSGSIGDLKGLTDYKNLYEISIDSFGGWRIYLRRTGKDYVLLDVHKKEDQQRELPKLKMWLEK